MALAFEFLVRVRTKEFRRALAHAAVIADRVQSPFAFTCLISFAAQRHEFWPEFQIPLAPLAFWKDDMSNFNLRCRLCLRRNSQANFRRACKVDPLMNH